MYLEEILEQNKRMKEKIKQLEEENRRLKQELKERNPYSV